MCGMDNPSLPGVEILPSLSDTQVALTEIAFSELKLKLEILFGA